MEVNRGKQPLSEMVDESRVPKVCLLQCLHGNSRWDTWIIFFQEAITRKQCFSEGLLFSCSGVKSRLL